MINVGVIGAGKWGINHVRAYANLDSSVRLVGIADPSEAAEAVARKFRVRWFRDVREMLDQVDAVSVVTPTNTHFPIVHECLKAGKHVLVEKPITLESSKNIKLAKFANAKNLVLQVGYLFRYNSAVVRLKELMSEIGDIQYLTARYIHSTKPPRTDCGALFNLSIHMVDTLCFVLGRKPKKIFCKTMHYLSEEREDAAEIILDFGSFFAALEVSWLHPKKERDIWVVASKEKVYSDLLRQSITRYPKIITLKKTQEKPPVEEEVIKNEPLTEELKFFVSSIENARYSFRIERPNERRRIDEEQYLSTKICEAAMRSSQLGREVTL